MTQNEYAVLKTILHNYFSPTNGAGTEEDIDGEIWSNCINDSNYPSGIEGKPLSGVVSNLKQKGFVKAYHGGRDSTVCITRAGYDAFKAHNPA